MAEFEDMMENIGATTITETQQNEIDVQEIYSGPWIEKRIEYKANNDKHHEVIMFGSWNGFRQGEEMERHAKQIYVATIKLPLGSWVYRFQLDKEDWETNNETAKTIKDGIEFNTVTIKEKEDIDEDDMEDKNEDGNVKMKHTQVIFDESSQKFVVGKKKRHGRPSMELDLGIDFDDDTAQPEEAEEPDDDEEEDDIPQENIVDIDTIDAMKNLNIDDKLEKIDGPAAMTTAITNALGKDVKSRNRKSNKSDRKRRKKRKTLNKKEQPEDKEFARKVFVEQLRQQQQHEDEINRVKLLWKQERQVRVEMHKKIIKDKKKTGSRCYSTAIRNRAFTNSW